jgi:S1-C subfamily serine protease
MPETVKKTITFSYGVFACILLATLLIGLLSGGLFGSIALSLHAQRSAAANQQTLQPGRPWVGITYIPITADFAESRNLSTTTGVLIVAVTPNSPAATAGLADDDIIVAMDGRTIDDSTSVIDVIKDKKAGDSVQIKFLHKGIEQTVNIVLGRSPIGPASPDDRSPLDRLRRIFTRSVG